MILVGHKLGTQIGVIRQYEGELPSFIQFALVKLAAKRAFGGGAPSCSILSNWPIRQRQVPGATLELLNIWILLAIGVIRLQDV